MCSVLPCTGPEESWHEIYRPLKQFLPLFPSSLSVYRPQRTCLLFLKPNMCNFDSCVSAEFRCFGWRSGESSSRVLTKLVHKIQQSLSSYLCTVAIFLYKIVRTRDTKKKHAWNYVPYRSSSTCGIVLGKCKGIVGQASDFELRGQLSAFSWEVVSEIDWSLVQEIWWGKI